MLAGLLGPGGLGLFQPGHGQLGQLDIQRDQNDARLLRIQLDGFLVGGATGIGLGHRRRTTAQKQPERRNHQGIIPTLYVAISIDGQTHPAPPNTSRVAIIWKTLWREFI
jgi:hypothetical protein